MKNQNRSVKQLVILSGKGGTGKTCICASLTHLASQSEFKCVLADADVDAANLALITQAEAQETHAFSGSQLAVIHQDLCISCGKCFDVCRFNAVHEPESIHDEYHINDLLCEGCASCVYACPYAAISMVVQEDGEWFHSTSPYGDLFHAELFPAAENTGKLVTTVKQNAKLFAEDHQLPLMIVDGPPGIGCPVISASAGADLALLVAEPGVSGLHDLERIIHTLEHFKIPMLICVNKADLFPEGTRALISLAESLDLTVASEIPFDEAFPKAMVFGQPITQYAPSSHSSQAIIDLWGKIQEILFHEKGLHE